MNPKTTKLHNSIEKVNSKILFLCAKVETAVQNSVIAVKNNDKDLAKSIIKEDKDIDFIEVQIEEQCLNILATQQPVAIDLRSIVALLKVNNDLERIGDHASNIAGRALSLSKLNQTPLPFDNIIEMANKTRKMLKDAIDSLINHDENLAQHVLSSDDEVDLLNKKSYEFVNTIIQENPSYANALLNFLSISRQLERIADYATNIAEDVIYMIKGNIIRHGAKYIDK